MLVAQVGTRSRSSLLRVGSLVRGWFTSIICLLIGKKKKPADGAREHTPGGAGPAKLRCVHLGGLEQGCGEWAQEVMGQLQACSPGAG